MDPLENEIKEIYRQRKREDEKSIPAFNTFLVKKELLRRPLRSYTLLKVAASVTGAIIFLSYYFFGVSKHAKPTVETHPEIINQSLPSQSLLNESFGDGYIWHWKAPSDKLMENAKKLI